MEEHCTLGNWHGEIWVTTVYPFQVSPSTHLSTSQKGKMNSWVNYTPSARGGFQSWERGIAAVKNRHANHRTTKAEKEITLIG